MPGKYSHSVVLADYSSRGIISLPEDQRTRYVNSSPGVELGRPSSAARRAGTRSAQTYRSYVRDHKPILSSDRLQSSSATQTSNGQPLSATTSWPTEPYMQPLEYASSGSQRDAGLDNKLKVPPSQYQSKSTIQQQQAERMNFESDHQNGQAFAPLRDSLFDRKAFRLSRSAANLREILSGNQANESTAEQRRDSSNRSEWSGLGFASLSKGVSRSSSRSGQVKSEALVATGSQASNARQSSFLADQNMLTNNRTKADHENSRGASEMLANTGIGTAQRINSSGKNNLDSLGMFYRPTNEERSTPSRQTLPNLGNNTAIRDHNLTSLTSSVSGKSLSHNFRDTNTSPRAATFTSFSEADWRLPEIQEDYDFNPCIFEDDEHNTPPEPSHLSPYGPEGQLDPNQIGHISSGRDVLSDHGRDDDAMSDLSAALPPAISRFKDEEDEFVANMTKIFGKDYLSKSANKTVGANASKKSKGFFSRFRSKG